MVNTLRRPLFGLLGAWLALGMAAGRAHPFLGDAGPTGEPAPVVAVFSGPRQQVPGHLVGEASSGFRFVPEGSNTPSDLLVVDEFLFESPSLVSSAAAPPFRVDMGLLGRISGRLQSITPDAIVLDAGDQEAPLEIRRPAVRAIEQRPGEAQVFADGFEGATLASRTWQRVGQPDLSTELAEQGRQSLRLPPGGSGVTLRLPEPIEAGRFSIAFHEDGRRATNQTRFVDLTFRGPGGLRSVQVLLGWQEETLGVRTRGPEPTLAVQPSERRSGWRRLTIRFDARRTDVAVDGIELAHGDAPGGPLVEIRLASDATRDGLVAHFDDLRLVRSITPLSGVETEPSQDEVRLITGDQVFGTVRSGDASRIDVELDGSTFSVGWEEVGGIHFRRGLVPSLPVEGLWVEARWMPPGYDDDRASDRLVAVLRSIDRESVRLAAPDIGEVILPTSRLSRLTVLGRAWRMVVDANPRHLGNRVVPSLDPPQPEGSELELTFPLESVPEGRPRLLVEVVQVIGVDGDANYSKQVREGWLRTHVELNGQQVGDLNSQVTSRNDEPLTVRLPIPDGLLVEGENRVRFSQDGTQEDPDVVDNLGLIGIILEAPIPEPPQDPVQP